MTGDVLEPVEGRFDLVVFDLPFRWFPARDMAERATTDPGYRALTAFFDGVRSRLTRRGRMLVFFGTSGDLDFLRELAARHGFTVETVAGVTALGREEPVSYYTFRMSWEQVLRVTSRSRSRCPPGATRPS
ncbi:hypothetical protein [Actinopolyspora mortivallis]|uniref:hypothetical protein n=1 Tax=Actinopolyspora mortivallis TaxID=33906 RepID=UPI0011B24624|nr:hypothetical protein [Actinopolyspora mortivallis]